MKNELELIEEKRKQKVTEILSKVILKQEITETEKYYLNSNIKDTDLSDNILIVKKGKDKFIVTYSDHRFTFEKLNNETKTKRIPLQILGCKYGSCLTYLQSLNFEIDKL